MNVTKLAVGLLAVASMLVAGCSTTGSSRPSSARAIAGVNAGSSQDVMAFVAVYNSGADMPTFEQYRVSNSISTRVCKVQVDTQLESAWKAKLSGATELAPGYAVAGAAQYLYPFATATTAGAGAVVGGLTGAVGGWANGKQVWSMNRANQFRECLMGAVHNYRQGDPIHPGVLADMGGEAAVKSALRGLTIGTSWTGTRNRDQRPSWSGETVGQPN